MRIWDFSTENTAVRMHVAPDEAPDMSWDEDGRCSADIAAGKLTEPFVVVCTVYINGIEVGSDVLGGCIYESAEAFANGDNRNGYFRDMVRQSVSEAREVVAGLRIFPLRS